MADINDIRLKERNADYFYESFERYYRQGDYLDACLNFWKSAQLIIASIASFENKEVKDMAQTKQFLQKFVQEGEITPSEVSALEIIYLNRLRVNSDESMLALQLERAGTLLRKLRQILKDYSINGPPQEMSDSIFPSNTATGNQAQSYEQAQEQDSTQQDLNQSPEKPSE
jgi:hypothetical protein